MKYYYLILNLTESINLHSVFLRKTHCIGIEFFGKMKISKIKENWIQIINLKKKQKQRPIYSS
jgi:hypothetical protein